MKVRLTQLRGTLLYSIDNHGNQLIMSLYDNIEPNIGIEFRKKEEFFSLRLLCRCTICRFEYLDLTIKIRSDINVRCNEGSLQRYSYSTSKRKNEAYPLPFSIEGNPTSLTKAHLWLINTPFTESLYPNQDQLKGCIYNVWYNDEPVIFTNITGNVVMKCNQKCLKNTCHGGKCLETYSDRILCNCTETFRNGEFCNKTMNRVNLHSVGQSFQMNMFKISWRAPSCNLFEMNNTYILIRLHCLKTMLLLQISFTKEKKVTLVERVLSSGYDSRSEYIMIAVFYEAHVNIQFYNNGSLYHSNILFPYNLRKEVFTSITLQGEDQDLDFVVKTDDYSWRWNEVHFKKYKEIKKTINKKEVNKRQISITKTKVENLNHGYIIGFSILIPLATVGIIGSILYSKKRKIRSIKKSFKKKYRRNINSFEEIPLIENDEKDYENKVEEEMNERSLILQNISTSSFTKEEKLNLYLIMDDIILNCHQKDKKKLIFSLVQEILYSKKINPLINFAKEIEALHNLVDPSFSNKEKDRRLGKIQSSVQRLINVRKERKKYK